MVLKFFIIHKQRILLPSKHTAKKTCLFRVNADLLSVYQSDKIIGAAAWTDSGYFPYMKNGVAVCPKKDAGVQLFHDGIQRVELFDLKIAVIQIDAYLTVI